MKTMQGFESMLEREVREAAENGPEALRRAMSYAVFPGGGRVRPRLGLSIVEALGRAPDDAAMGGAMAVELIHCASLVHDDMPCFDDARTRRGKPSVHRVFGEDTALLVGDALIGAAFGVLAKHGVYRPNLIGPMVRVLSDALGASEGIIAGQASEEDASVSVTEVHRKKTGALFEAAAAMAALSVGVDTRPWRAIGQTLGAAYQLADDILDTVGETDFAGKPVDQDARRARPNAVNEESLVAAVTQLDDLIDSAIHTIPPCPGRNRLVTLLIGVATRLCPPTMIPRDTGLMTRVGMARAGADTALGKVG